ncbi:MAG: membrane protein insertase YidC [Clostridia bacterium]|nr:membrane protein insertase YidC [Clostridia bacterium]
MNFISEFFGTIFDWINGFTNNYGISIVLFTILFRLLLLPFDVRSRVGQREYSAKMKKIQPEVDMINKAYKNSPEKAQQMIMDLRKREGIGMLPKGCGTMLITYPILIAFFAVFRNLAAEKLVELSTLTDQTAIAQWFDTNSFLWVKNIWQPDVYFNFNEVWGLRTFWIIKDINGPVLPLAEQISGVLQSAFNGGMLSEFNPNGLDLAAFAQQVGDNLALARDYVATTFGTAGNGFYILPILAGVVQVLSFNATSQQQQPASNDPAAANAASTGKFMKIFFPLMFVYFCLVSSTALAIYWITSSLCMLLSNFIINKVLDEKEKKNSLTQN